MESLDIFQNPSLSTLGTRDTAASLESEVLMQKFVIIDEVKITPGYMHFEDAYDGKLFKQKLIIQNCGVNSVFVRLGEANSMSFEFKAFPDGHYLSPGLKIVRTITHLHRATIGVMRGYAPIHINERKINYNFYVSMSSAILSLEPQPLEFGRIDAVAVATMRTLYIKNSGSKGTQFAIDLGRNEMELIVEPMKGTVPAKSKVALHVELVGSKEGEFMEEFWIKANPPLRAVISGLFIAPKLMVRKFIDSLDFTLMDFQPTYFGSHVTKPLLIKNSSPSPSMYCVLSEVKGSLMPLDKAVKLDSSFTNFKFRSIEGRVAADKGSVIQITYAPVKTPNERGYAACFLKVIRLDCRDVYNNEFQDVLNVEDCRSRDTTISNASIPSVEKILPGEENEADNATLVIPTVLNTHISLQQAIGICLYGVKEEAGVLIRPDLITLDDLMLNQSYERELFVENKSSRLPIEVRYRKIVGIEVVPDEFGLKPKESVEVKVVIRALKFGNTRKKIYFDLLAYDYPRSQGILRTVGSALLKFSYSVNKLTKKSKMKQCALCYNDLSLQLTPDFPFRSTPSEHTKHMKNKIRYAEFLKRSRTHRKSKLIEFLVEDYETTNNRHLLLQNVRCQNPPTVLQPVAPLSPFVPLTPREIYNIRIEPKIMTLAKVAAFSTIFDHFTIENKNPFPVRVLLKASKSCIAFDNDSRYVVHGGEKKVITFFFFTTHIGRYYISIFALVNDSSLFEVTAAATVVPKIVHVDSPEIEFAETDGDYKFFNLTNVLNSCMYFDWDIPESCFKIYPLDGNIKPERSLTSAVLYDPTFGQPDMTEGILTSESGHKRIMQFCIKRKRPVVSFDSYDIDFGVVPLNVSVRKVIILRNKKDFKSLFTVPNVTPIPGLHITPKEGILGGKASQVFIVTGRFQAVVQFSTEFTFMVDEETEFKVAVRGLVEYPKYAMTPGELYFRKISPYSFDTLAFKVKNLSSCESSLAFPTDESPEFSVTEDEESHSPHRNSFLLQPQEAKVLFLHFHPECVTTSAFNLVYTINGILGPCIETCNPHHFLDDAEKSYEGVKGVTLVAGLPRNLPVIRVNCRAIDKILWFSTLNVKLVYYAEDHYANVASGDVEVTNISTETVKFCFRTDDLLPPFYLMPKNGDEIEYFDVSYLITLDPGQSIAFEASFEPYEVGDYTIRLPIFVRHYRDNTIFNYLTLNGVYDLPTMTISTSSIHFEPVPIKVKNEVRLTLYMENHSKNCQVYATTESNFLYAIFESGRCPKPGRSTLPVSVVLDPMTTLCFNCELVFKCTCRSSCTVAVTGVAENCLFTNHALEFLLRQEEGRKASNAGNGVFEVVLSSLVNKNTTCFPYFPEDGDHSSYACYMRRIHKAVENWIYSQAFYSKSYYRIPDSFIYYSRTTEEPKKKGMFATASKPTFNQLPLLQLLMNLTGPDIKECLVPSEATSDDEVDILIHTCKTYLNILEYLDKFTIHTPHVKAEYLLNYNQYCLYEKLMNQNYEPPMEEESFSRLSKQCWLDLLLQIVKLMFFERIVEPIAADMTADEVATTRNERALSTVSEYSTDFDPFENILFYGNYERALLSWLETCYAAERETLWAECDGVPEAKEVTNFNTSLRDGLVLGAVTVHYCPYVRHVIQSMFVKPKTPEDSFHNLCTVLRAWKPLSMSYSVNPFVLKSATDLEMLLLITYLYDVLPSCYVRDTITINAPLTQYQKAEFMLQNTGTSPINYTVVYFGNEQEFFSVMGKKDSPIKIPAGKKKKVAVQYYAKCVAEARVTIFFSGETPGQKYGKSLAVEVVGTADVSNTYSELTLSLNLYKMCEVTLDIEAPFKTRAVYTAFLNLDDGPDYYALEDITKLKISKEFLFQKEVFEFDDGGMHTLKALACCQVPGTRTLRIYFSNPDVGDWAIKLVVTGKVTPDCYEDVKVLVPDNYDQLACRCKGDPEMTKNCPRLLTIRIPKQNRSLWEGRKKMVIHSVEKMELVFWEKRIYTTIGTRILALIFSSETHPLRHILDEPIEYEVQRPKDCPFITVDSLVIDDICSEHHVDILIHPLKSLRELYNTKFELVAKNERRFYKLILRNKTGSISNLTMGSNVWSKSIIKD